MKAETRTVLDLARTALVAARRDLGAGDARAAVSRAYYAVFYAATAALRERGLVAKSHAGTHALFARHIVQEGAFSPEQGLTLPRLFQQRQDADYVFAVEATRAEAEAALERAQAFVAAVEAWLGRTGEGAP